ncbi:MAG: hypothetical protein ACI9HY_004290 [Planctomycetaceae bacterium]|jgi:hypothetical protein
MGMWTSIAVIAIVAIVCQAVSKIFGGGRGSTKRSPALQEDFSKLEGDLEDAIDRIIVLEKIVTDGKHSLRRDIDDLAG